jgi:hypothetical protein
MILSFTKAAAASAIATLAFGSAQNMWQTLRITRQKDSSPALAGPISVPALQRLNRAELLQLFCSNQCREPTLREMQGDWNGILLENNGFVMVRFVKLIIHCDVR